MSLVVTDHHFVGSVILVLVTDIPDSCRYTPDAFSSTEAVALGVWILTATQTQGASCYPCADDAQCTTEEWPQAEETVLTQHKPLLPNKQLPKGKELEMQCLAFRKSVQFCL